MAVTEETVAKIAHLSRLQLAPEQAALEVEALSRILDWVEQMQAINTADVEPMAHPFKLSQRLRPDTVTETDQHAVFQKIAPQVEAGLYLVPQVIE